jgi:elongator complex protein 3
VQERHSRRLATCTSGGHGATISGVAPVAVLTEPYPCPGTCIFCPEQKEAPKSYLNGEPGVLRALQNDYGPYEQTSARLTALEAIGHTTDKVELWVLGGTWSYYPETYRQNFLRRCFEALNESPSETLAEALCPMNCAHRIVGLVVETRPDWISRMKSFGCGGRASPKCRSGCRA